MKNTFKSLQENALLRVVPTMTFQDIYFTWIETSILTFNLAYILTFNLRGLQHKCRIMFSFSNFQAPRITTQMLY